MTTKILLTQQSFCTWKNFNFAIRRPKMKYEVLKNVLFFYYKNLSAEKMSPQPILGSGRLTKRDQIMVLKSYLKFSIVQINSRFMMGHFSLLGGSVQKVVFMQHQNLNLYLHTLYNVNLLLTSLQCLRIHNCCRILQLPKHTFEMKEKRLIFPLALEDLRK